MMEWTILPVSTLRAPEFVDCSAAQRAAWIGVLLYSAEQENGGRIIGGARWTDRQWLQSCGVSARDVRGAVKLLPKDGDDVLVWRYPKDKEQQVRRNRENGRLGGSASTEKKVAAARDNGQKRRHLESPSESQAPAPSKSQAGGGGEKPTELISVQEERVESVKDANGSTQLTDDELKKSPRRNPGETQESWLSRVQKTLPTHNVEAIFNKYLETAKERGWRVSEGGFLGFIAKEKPALESIPKKKPPRSDDPPRWKEFLKTHSQPYADFRFALDFLKSRFEEWKTSPQLPTPPQSDDSASRTVEPKGSPNSPEKDPEGWGEFLKKKKMAYHPFTSAKDILRRVFLSEQAAPEEPIAASLS